MQSKGDALKFYNKLGDLKSLVSSTETAKNQMKYFMKT